MPILKSALKALRRDKRRTKVNKPLKTAYQTVVKKVRQSPTKQNLTQAYSILDKAAKKNIIHKNKASRLKANLTKLVKQEKVENSVTKTAKKPVKQKKTGTKKPSKKTTKK